MSTVTKSNKNYSWWVIYEPIGCISFVLMKQNSEIVWNMEIIFFPNQALQEVNYIRSEARVVID